MIGGNAARALEPELACIGALSSPESGIVDSHGYTSALWGELQDRGGSIAFETPVERMSYAAPQWRVQFGGRDAGVVEFDAGSECQRLEVLRDRGEVRGPGSGRSTGGFSGPRRARIGRIRSKVAAVHMYRER